MTNPRPPRALPWLALLALACLAGPRPAAAQSETLRFAPVADTYVESTQPARNFDRDVVLKTDADPERIIYLRFAVSGVGARVVQQARLRLEVAGPSNTGGTIHRISGGAWDAATLTYDTRPAVDGPPLDTLGAVTLGAVVEFNLDGAVAGDGVYDLAIDSASSDGVSYVSSAATSGLRPELLLIVPAGPAPTVRILEPADGATLLAGHTITLRGEAFDVVDGDLGAGLAWTSSLQGRLGTGPLVMTGLVPGTHRITAAVADSGGNEGTASVTVTVDHTVISLPAVADAYVDAAAPTANFGAASTLRVDADVERNAFLRFVVTGAGTRPATRAVLRLRVDGGSGASSDSGGIVRLLADTGWDERTVTFASRPAVDGPALASAGRVAAGSLVDFDVTAAGLTDGVYAFALVSTSSDGVTYRTRESADPPLLLLTPAGHAPQVRITAPGDGTVVFGDAPIVCAAMATDAEDGDLSAALTWTSSLDGAFGRGATASTAGLATGLHTITAAATDLDGRTGEAHIALLVRAPNQPPAIAITSPAGPTMVVAGTFIEFAASAADDFDGDLGESIEWSSDLQGPLGTGASLVRNLVAGSHVVTAAVTDGDGLAAAARVFVTVEVPPPGAPRVAIVTPRDGQIAAAGEAIVFEGVADDAEDGVLTDRLVWTSDVDGPLGSGGTFARTLTPATHRITAAVTDRDGRRGSAAVTITVAVADAGEMAFEAVADAYVDAKSPARNFGGSAKLLADASPERLFLLRFEVRGLGPFTVSEARLRLTVRPQTADGGPDGGRVHRVPAQSWSERGVTYATRPAVEGRMLDAAGAVVAGQVVDLDVSAAVAGEGVYDFAVVTSSTNGVAYRSRESVTGRPELVVTLGVPRVVLTGTFAEPYDNRSLPPDATIDARAATFLGFPAGSHPVNLGGGPGVHLIGGTVLGQYDRSWSWTRMHDLNHAGVAVENVDAIVEGVRVDNMGDGIRPRADSGSFTIRGVRLSYIRDDCVEDDNLLGGLVDDSLFDGCYVGFSTRPSTEKMDNGANGTGRVLRIRNSLVRLQPMPGPDGGSADGLGHGGFFKWHLWNDPAASLSPQLALHGNVFMAERVGQVGAERMGVPPGQLVSCSDNVMVWLGPGPYPAPLPPCFTVTTHRRVWDDAVADWESRHPAMAP